MKFSTEISLSLSFFHPIFLSTPRQAAKPVTFCMQQYYITGGGGTTFKKQSIFTFSLKLRDNCNPKFTPVLGRALGTHTAGTYVTESHYFGRATSYAVC